MKREKSNDTLTTKVDVLTCKYHVENLEGLIKLAVNDGLIKVDDGFKLYRELIEIQGGTPNNKDIQELRDKITELENEIISLKQKDKLTLPYIPSPYEPWTDPAKPWTTPTSPYPWVTWYNTNEIKAGDVITKTYNGPFEFTTTCTSVLNNEEQRS